MSSDTELAGCRGKASFRHWSQARKQARRTSRRRCYFVNCYRCKKCGAIHNGTNENGRKMRLAFKRRKDRALWRELNQDL